MEQKKTNKKRLSRLAYLSTCTKNSSKSPKPKTKQHRKSCVALFVSMWSKPTGKHRHRHKGLAMVIEEEQKTTPTQLDLFANNLPHKPYCTDEKGWLQVRKKATAIGKKYIQHNQPCLVHWLVYDYDRAGALQHIGDNQLPVPNIVATNPANGNNHLFYKLADPVCTSELAHQKPLHLLAKIDYVLCEKLEADTGYQGFISKNVLHKHWLVQEVNQHPWNLADFLEWIDLPRDCPSEQKCRG